MRETLLKAKFSFAFAMILRFAAHMNYSTVIKSPIVTEKTIRHNTYAFAVDPQATKGQIREVIEKHFGVKVEKITTSIRKGKTHRSPRSRAKITVAPRKKAIVSLKKGQTIPELEVKS